MEPEKTRVSTLEYDVESLRKENIDLRKRYDFQFGLTMVLVLFGVLGGIYGLMITQEKEGGQRVNLIDCDPGIMLELTGMNAPGKLKISYLNAPISAVNNQTMKACEQIEVIG